MTIKVIEGNGSEACPQGYYALYEHPNCNGTAKGRVLIADQSMDDHHMGAPVNFRDTTTCVVNRTSRTLELFQRPGLQGERLTVPPGGPYDLRELKNEQSKSLNDDVSSTRLGDPPSDSLLSKFRKAGYQVSGGKVDQETGEGQAGDSITSTLRNIGWVGTGGKVAEKDKQKKQSDQLAAQEKAAAEKAAKTPQTYQVKIKTAGDSDAGTTDDIHCRFRRGERVSEWVNLDRPAQADLRAGYDDWYDLAVPGDFGAPKRIEFKTNGTDDWLLEWVIVQTTDQKSQWHCPMLNLTKVWLSKDAPPNPELVDRGHFYAQKSVSLFLALGYQPVKDEPNPDYQAWGRTPGEPPDQWGPFPKGNFQIRSTEDNTCLHAYEDKIDSHDPYHSNQQTWHGTGAATGADKLISAYKESQKESACASNTGSSTISQPLGRLRYRACSDDLVQRWWWNPGKKLIALCNGHQCGYLSYTKSNGIIGLAMDASDGGTTWDIILRPDPGILAADPADRR